MLAFARSRSPSVEFVRGDATELPFPADSFDATTCAFLLLHLGRPETAAAEAARVLVTGGRAGSALGRAGAGPWLGVVFDASRPRVRPRRPMCRTAHRSSGSQTTASSSGYWLTRGLTDVAIKRVEFYLQLTSADELWKGLVGQRVRYGR